VTRPVAEILAKAEREHWPTSFIDAMANHHLCGGITRDYVNECFSEPGALGSEIGDGGSPNGCGPARTGPHPPNFLDERDHGT
jgi:hypothetical protein